MGWCADSNMEKAQATYCDACMEEAREAVWSMDPDDVIEMETEAV